MSLGDGDRRARQRIAMRAGLACVVLGVGGYLFWPGNQSDGGNSVEAVVSRAVETAEPEEEPSPSAYANYDVTIPDLLAIEQLVESRSSENDTTTTTDETTTSVDEESEDGTSSSTDQTSDTTATTSKSATTAAETPTTAAQSTTQASAQPAQGSGGQSAAAGAIGNSAPGTGQRFLYVDGNSGNDLNPGTEDRPFRRPVTALNIATPGTTIYLRGGVYDTNTHGSFNTLKSGTAQNWIKIAPYPGERVELRAGGQYESAFTINGQDYVEITGLVLRGRSDSIHGSGVLVKDNAHNIRIAGNEITGWGGGGISVVESSMITIEGNTISDNGHRSSYQGSGVSLFRPMGPTAGGNFSLVVRNNYIFGNYNNTPNLHEGAVTDGNCIIMDRFNETGYSGRTLVENNVCAENGGRGVHIYQAGNIVARNNTLYYNMWSGGIQHGRGEMTSGEGRNNVFYNNLVFNRPGVPSYIDNGNTNTYFNNNYVAHTPPPGNNNQVLGHGASHYFSSTGKGGNISQWRPHNWVGLGGTADGANQSWADLTGQQRPSPGAVGALEP